MRISDVRNSHLMSDDRAALSLMSITATVVSVETSRCHLLVGTKVRLNWFRPTTAIRRGDFVRAQIKLRKPWGTKSPGGFDYGRWLLGQGFVATGSIIHLDDVWQDNLPADKFTFSRVQFATSKFVNAGLMNAAILGDRSGVTASQWSLFRATGTIHLMVVSGLHVGVFGGIVFLVLYSVARVLPPRILRIQPRQVAMVGSILSLYILVLQTGAQPPVLRAVLMASGVMLAIMSRRNLPWPFYLCATGCVTILIHPEFIVQQGFWLSYIAVGSLLFALAPRLPHVTAIYNLILSQRILFLALTPLLGVSVGIVPIVAPLANLLVVPLMTIVTIPAGMTGVILQGFGWPIEIAELFLQLADLSLSVVLETLEIFSLDAFTLGYFSHSKAVMASLSALILLSPIALKLRLLACLGWMPLLCAPFPNIPYGEFRVQILDVGQGSSVVVDTQNHRLLIDTGAATPTGFSFSEAVVVPAIRASGQNILHSIIISHPDNDHAGGLPYLRLKYPGAKTYGVEQPCRDGKIWVQDNVEFELLVDQQGTTSNDRSCTLWISNRRTNVFMSGDISRVTEQKLIRRLPMNIDVLLAPHHGSNSSSSNKFVARLKPKIVIFSAGRNNRYDHPRKNVVQRYARRGALVYQTSKHGTIVWQSLRPERVETWRCSYRC